MQLFLIVPFYFFCYTFISQFDALEPACRAFTENVSLLLNKTSDTSSFCSNVTEAVWKGCNSTKDMQAM